MKRPLGFFVQMGLTAFLGLLLTGCTHTVKYKLAEGDRWQGSRISKTLRVDTFAETNAAYTEREIALEGKPCRTNYRKGYSNEQLAGGVSDMIAKHLAHSGLFKSATRNGSEVTDWVLSGTIKEYKVAASVNPVAEGVQAGTAGFGLIGAIIGSASTAGMKTEVTANVELAPVTLRDNAGKVIWQATLNAKTNFTAHFSAANQQAVFYHADELLKQVVNQLIERIAKEQTQIAAGTQMR